MFNQGDKVVLNDDEDAQGNWEGLTGTVRKDSDNSQYVQVIPDVDRPDGFEKDWFFWPINKTNKI